MCSAHLGKGFFSGDNCLEAADSLGSSSQGLGPLFLRRELGGAHHVQHTDLLLWVCASGTMLRRASCWQSVLTFCVAFRNYLGVRTPKLQVWFCTCQNRLTVFTECIQVASIKLILLLRLQSFCSVIWRIPPSSASIPSNIPQALRLDPADYPCWDSELTPMARSHIPHFSTHHPVRAPDCSPRLPRKLSREVRHCWSAQLP